MKALIKTAQGEGAIELTEFQIPEGCHDDEVRIAIEWVGICGTDISIMRGTADFITPMVLGHELSGTVMEVGKNVTKVKAGDKVTAETSCVVCGECKVCKAGAYNVCRERLGMGRTFHGAFCKERWLNERLVHKLADSVALDDAALCEPAAVTFHAVNVRAKLKAGENAYVFGAGPIGMLTAQMALAAGAKVTVLGLACDKEKLKMCEKWGCSSICLNEEPKFSDDVDVVFDCSGAPSALRQGMEILNPRGRYVQVGLFRKDPEVPMNLVCAKELEIYGCYSTVSSDFEGVAALLAEGKVDFGCLITGKYDLENWEDAFHDAMGGESIKVLIHP